MGNARIAAHLSRRPGQFSHLLSGAALEMQLEGAPICATAVSVERIGEQAISCYSVVQIKWHNLIATPDCVCVAAHICVGGPDGALETLGNALAAIRATLRCSLCLTSSEF